MSSSVFSFFSLLENKIAVTFFSSPTVFKKKITCRIETHQSPVSCKRPELLKKKKSTSWQMIGTSLKGSFIVWSQLVHTTVYTKQVFLTQGTHTGIVWHRSFSLFVYMIVVFRSFFFLFFNQQFAHSHCKMKAKLSPRLHRNSDTTREGKGWKEMLW